MASESEIAAAREELQEAVNRCVQLETDGNDGLVVEFAGCAYVARMDGSAIAERYVLLSGPGGAPSHRVVGLAHAMARMADEYVNYADSDRGEDTDY